MRKINTDILIITHHKYGNLCLTIISLFIGYLNGNINYLNIEYNEYENSFGKTYVQKRT